MPSQATLYLHIPFCVAKCSYCSFNSYPVAHRNLAAYMKALETEAERLARHPWAQEREFVSLYVGGGTPTIYEGPALGELIDRITGLFNFVEHGEVTVEANPNTISLEKLDSLKKAGVNRLSIGIQSFDDHLLAAHGRTHTAAEGVRGVQLAAEAGFENVSFDLIYGLPGQTEELWRETLRQALALKPKHVSLYELMVEEGTVLAKQVEARKVRLADEDSTLAMQTIAEALLQEQGLKRYEISNYGQTGFESRHNIHYWENHSYLGMGAGAVSSLSGLRTRNMPDPDIYAGLVEQGSVSYEDAEALGQAARFRETVIMGLRMTRGVQVAELQKRFGFSLMEYYGTKLTELQEKGLIAHENGWLRLTEKGLPVANQVLSELV